MIDAILNSSFFQNLIQILFSAVAVVVSVVLLPFGILIQTLMPQLDGALLQISAFFTYVTQYLGWVINAVAIPPIVITMVVGYYTFILSATMGAWLIKLILKWKKALIT